MTLQPLTVAGRQGSLARLALCVTVAAAAATRLSWLNLMEFKGDEAAACSLALHALGYSEPGVGRFFPTEGLISSIGVPNPPLFVYLMAIPLAIVRSPIAAVSVVAAANVVSIWVCYLVGKRCFSPFVGVAAAALYAVSPWGIIFSRKIWAQDLLPLCTTLFILELHALLVRRKPAAVFWLFLIATAATQLHFSAWILAPILGVALVLGRDAIERRWLILGAATAALLYAPFLVEHAGSIYRASGHRVSSHAPGIVARFEAAARFTFAIVGGDKMSFLLGSQSKLAAPVSLVLGPAALAGLVIAYRACQQRPLREVRMLLAVWSVLPLIALSILPVHDHIHYFIIIFPLPFLGIAYLVERLAARRQLLAGLAFSACLICFLTLDAGIFRTIVHDGGAPGDYGVAYRYKSSAVVAMLSENRGRPFLVGTDRGFRPVRRLRDIRFLIWNSNPSARPSGQRAAYGYVIVSKSRRLPPLLANDPRVRTYRRTAYGPLELITVPLAGN
jgi:Dolichyl-phosphate-mannose-protein mannosyltransferase